ncbi:MAG: anti-sigma factor family protein [Pyrinomonadaceae bacterium]
MKCSEIQFDLSFYADGSLSDISAAAVRDHLHGCPLCRQTYAETVEMRNSLRRMRRPEVSAALSRSIKDAAIGERSRIAQSWLAFPTDIRYWIEMRLMPFGVGVLASVLVGFAFTTMLFSNLIDYGQVSPGDASAQRARNRDRFDNRKVGPISPEEYAQTRLAFAGESPSVNPNGALVALTKTLIRGDMTDDEVVVVADVFSNGLAQIAEVVEPSRDQRAVAELAKALATDPAYAPFVPTTFEKRPENMRVVLRFQSVNVSMNQKRRR